MLFSLHGFQWIARIRIIMSARQVVCSSISNSFVKAELNLFKYRLVPKMKTTLPEYLQNWSVENWEGMGHF